MTNLPHDEIDWYAVQRAEAAIMGNAPYRGPLKHQARKTNDKPIPWVIIVLAIGAFVLGMSL